MEVGRRLRRFGRSQNQALLPLRSVQNLPSTFSCWYCDLKILSFNQPLYRFGQLHARFLRVWFTMGIGFTVSALLGVTMILIVESARILCQGGGSNKLDDHLSTLLFGFSPTVLDLSLSFADVACLVISTAISVAVHEFGHAIAAASEGIQLEYVAVFIAVLFPGALVAFDDDCLQAKPRKTSLRIYCAGIWHNAVCCAACGFTLLLLPFILSPLYVHNENPMVLDVSSTSPVSSYLSPGDSIVSLDGISIHSAREWTHLATMMEKQTWLHSPQNDANLSNVYPLISGDRRYCAPSTLVAKSKRVPAMTTSFPCSDDLTAFSTVICSHEDAKHKIDEGMICLNASDVVRFKKCGELESFADYGSSCKCSEDETCLSPVQLPGVAWVEITYQSPYGGGCDTHRNSTSSGSTRFEEACEKTFLYVGDVTSMAQSVRLTSYRPRLAFELGSYLPFIVEKSLMCTFHVSVTLGLLNSLPVYFLDGEYILEVCFCYLTFLSPRSRRILLQACLIFGSGVTCLVFLRNFIVRLW